MKIGNKRMQLLITTKQHGYGYVYRYRTDTDTRIRHFLRKPDTWIHFIIFYKKIIKDIKIIGSVCMDALLRLLQSFHSF